MSNVTDARPDPRLVSVFDAAGMTAVSRSRIYELLAQGELESVKIGSRRLVVVSSIDAYVDRLRSAGGPDVPGA